jgi:hypothetical protein
MKVASLDSVASQMDAAGFDKEDAYKRFDELLGTADVSFNQGDRVSTISELATCAAHPRFRRRVAPRGGLPRIVS